jgi:hypothetical protein
MRHLGMLIVGIAAATLAMGASQTAANAAPLQHEKISFEESFLDCGYENTATTDISNLLLDANPSTAGQFFRFSYTWQGSSTITNPLTGAYVTIRGHGLYKEIQPRDLGGGLFTYVAHTVATFVVRDSSGNVLLSEAGRIAFTWLFDSLGDSAPGGDMLDVTLVHVSGPHPEFNGDVDFCELLDSVIG